ncbi:hypothetical protein ABZ135_09170 [Streptomyces sp. NPDC006339]|uniref:hypothetical protein n=1 Tax=Streptomyces sp. NPDC006339 TaxID=3156755 RepID=UPI0033AC2DE2
MTSNDPDARATGAWIAPLVSTLVTVPLGLLTLFFAGLSPMACDSCNGAEADRFDASFAVAFPVVVTGLLVALGLLVTAWALPRRVRHSARRVGFALAAPATVVLAGMVFAGLLDTP